MDGTLTGGRRLRAAIVGGGEGSVIGATHRLALRLSERFELVAAAFDVDPARGRKLAESLFLSGDRIYENVEALIAGERSRMDPADLVCVLTPNHTHFEIARRLVAADFNVMCEKPLTTQVAEADELVRMSSERQLIFAVMYGYSGYPMVRHARALVESGQLGHVRVIHSEFALGTPSTLRAEPAGHWRTKRGLSGDSAVVGMVGTHALFLSTFISGLEIDEVSADFRTYVPGRTLEDNAHLLLRFTDGATGMMWNSYVAAGVENGLRVRVSCELGSLEWNHEQPNQLLRYIPGKPREILTLASRGPTLGAEGASIAAVQPEGFLEAFTNIYRDVADAIVAQTAGGKTSCEYPDAAAGAVGVRFVDATVRSSRQNAAWVKVAG